LSADDGGTLAAMLALHLPRRLSSINCSSHRNIREKKPLGGGCSLSRGNICQMKSSSAVYEGKTRRRGVGMNREGFVFEGEELEPTDRILHEVLSMEERGSYPMMQLYWSPRTRVLFRTLADGRDRAALRARADRPRQGFAEDAGISRHQSDGQGTGAEGRRHDARGKAAAICAYVAERYPDAKTGAAAWRPVAGEISLLVVFCTELHRARDGWQLATKVEMNPTAAGLGRCASGVRRARHRADERTLAARRDVLGRGPSPLDRG